MTEDFNAVLERLQGNLSQFVDDPQSAAGEFQIPEVEGHGTALDEQINVTMSQEKFTELTIDPRAMRLANAQLAEHLLEAFNAALEDHNRQMMEQLTQQHPTGDGESLQQDLRQIQADSLQAMKKYTDSLFDALGQVRRLSGQE